MVWAPAGAAADINHRAAAVAAVSVFSAAPGGCDEPWRVCIPPAPVMLCAACARVAERARARGVESIPFMVG